MCTLGTGHYFEVLFFNECSCLFGGENEPNHSVECRHITEGAQHHGKTQIDIVLNPAPTLN